VNVLDDLVEWLKKRKPGSTGAIYDLDAKELRELAREYWEMMHGED
jgi:hypothetical protein